MAILPLLTRRAEDGLLRTAQSTRQTSDTLPLYREIDWDFTRNRPLWRGGKPVYCTGARAVLVWAWNTLHVERGFYELFSGNYGQDLAALRGQPYTEEVQRSEAVRCIREALMVNPYITGVDQVDITLIGSTLRLSVRLLTVYGEVDMHGITL